MSAPLTSTGTQAQSFIPQAIQPTSMDTSRNVERDELSPNETQIQKTLAPSAQSQKSNETKDDTQTAGTKDILKFIMDVKEMQETGELPKKGAVLDIYS